MNRFFLFVGILFGEFVIFPAYLYFVNGTSFIQWLTNGMRIQLNEFLQIALFAFIGGTCSLLIDFDAIWSSFFKQASPLIASKTQWLPACEKVINEFLNAKYDIALDIAENTQTSNMFDIFVLIDGTKRGVAHLDIHNVDPTDEKSTRIVADHFIHDYNANREKSILFRALQQHSDFVAAEKKFKKVTRPVHKVTPDNE